MVKEKNNKTQLKPGLLYPTRNLSTSLLLRRQEGQEFKARLSIMSLGQKTNGVGLGMGRTLKTENNNW